MSSADYQNFPLLDESGAVMLRFLREHPNAPRYTHVGCDRLSAAGLERVRAYEAELLAPAGGRPPVVHAEVHEAGSLAPAGGRQQELPDWLHEFAAGCFQAVPFYRAYGALTLPVPAAFFDIPACNRDDLQAEPWAFVPDAQPLDDLVIYQTSGTTGHPLDILTHPEPLAMYLPLLRAALATRGVLLDAGANRVAIVCVCFQRSTWTYAAVLPALAQAGYAKINLNLAGWRAPSDREAFLDACDAQLYTGDPLSFIELSRLPLRTRPRALVSTAMALSPSLQRSLEERFGCPVFDLYSTNETGPIAVGGDGTFKLLQPRLYVEILDAEGNVCSPGTRGEVTVSGGFNPFLPLLRYRTGDYARLAFQGSEPVLVGLEGRPPVVFEGAAGQAINNIDVSNALKPFGLAQYALHQFRDGSLRLRVRAGHIDLSQTNSAGLVGVRAALLALFGAAQPLSIDALDAIASTGDKLVQYTRDT